MILHRNLKNLLAAASVAGLLCACSSAPFPEIIEEDDITLEDVMKKQSDAEHAKSKKVLKEGNSLASDEQNAAYESDEDDDIFADVSEDEEEKVFAAKTKPVIHHEKPTKAASVKSEPELLEEEIVEEAAVAEDDEPSVSYRVETIYFNNGSAAVDSEYNAKIRKVVREAKAKGAKVKVVGFASSRTRNTDIVSHKLANFKVSLQRAQNVAAALKRAGMKEQDIYVEAMSDTAPAYLEVMPEGERLNRRAEIYLSY